MNKTLADAIRERNVPETSDLAREFEGLANQKAEECAEATGRNVEDLRSNFGESLLRAAEQPKHDVTETAVHTRERLRIALSAAVSEVFVDQNRHRTIRYDDPILGPVDQSPAMGYPLVYQKEQTERGRKRHVVHKSQEHGG